MSDKPLVFLHLSDIHFTKHSGRPGDLDEDVRRELECDALEVRRRFDHFTGILVSGDIAFSGQAAEYDTAKSWLNQLCLSLGCAAEDVWVVPGNHDVDRVEVRASYGLQLVRSGLRPQDPRGVERAIAKLVGDPSTMELGEGRAVEPEAVPDPGETGRAAPILPLTRPASHPARGHHLGVGSGHRGAYDAGQMACRSRAAPAPIPRRQRRSDRPPRLWDQCPGQTPDGSRYAP